MTKLTTHAELLKHHGRKVTCIKTCIRNTMYVEAELFVADRVVRITGSDINYKFNLHLSTEQLPYEEYNRGVTNITLIDEMQFPCWMYVSNMSEGLAEYKKWKALVLADVGGASPYIAVCDGEDDLYPNGDYRTTAWTYAIPIPKPQTKIDRLIEAVDNGDMKKVKEIAEQIREEMG